jgi:S-adenosylmethionine synthetase
MQQDPYGRVACEVLVTTGTCVVAGEITTNCYVDVPAVVRRTIQEVGYTDATYGFDYKTAACSMQSRDSHRISRWEWIREAQAIRA